MHRESRIYAAVDTLMNAQTLRFQRLRRVHVELVFSEVYLARAHYYAIKNIAIATFRARKETTACATPSRAFSSARPIRFCYLDHETSTPRHSLLNGAQLKRKQILFIIVIRVVVRIYLPSLSHR